MDSGHIDSESDYPVLKDQANREQS